LLRHTVPSADIVVTRHGRPVVVIVSVQVIRELDEIRSQLQELSQQADR
jgi:prevent-host-death family protein